MTKSITSLNDLPDELLLEIVQHLSCIPLYEPQSTAFKEKEKEKARQFDNRVRQISLHSLCLASHQLRKIVTPTLYVSFTGSATWHNLKPLQLFHRTLSNSRSTLGLDVPLSGYLQYVKNRLSDYLGNSLYDDTQVDGALGMVSHYFLLLADVVKHAPNVQHLSIVSLETNEVSFWEYILSNGEAQQGDSSIVAIHGLCKLQTLCFKIHIGELGTNLGKDLFGCICSAMTSLPMLENFQTSGVVTNTITRSFPGMFQTLTRFEITQCMLELDDVICTWAACEGLRHIVYEWAFLNYSRRQPADLYPGLLRHCETLESLQLDMREVRMIDSESAFPQQLGSLQPFASLESLEICEVSLLGNTLSLLDCPDQLLQCYLLPAQLKRFAFLLSKASSYELDSRLDEAFALSNFVDDCQHHLTDMKEVGIKSGHALSAPIAMTKLEKADVRLNLVKEVKP